MLLRTQPQVTGLVFWRRGLRAFDGSVVNWTGVIDMLPKDHFALFDGGGTLIQGRLLTPYKAVRYHIREWGSSATRPQDKMELFNLRQSVKR